MSSSGVGGFYRLLQSGRYRVTVECSTPHVRDSGAVLRCRWPVRFEQPRQLPCDALCSRRAGEPPYAFARHRHDARAPMRQRKGVVPCERVADVQNDVCDARIVDDHDLYAAKSLFPLTNPVALFVRLWRTRDDSVALTRLRRSRRGLAGEGMAVTDDALSGKCRLKR
jgi:hypothetical protein